MRAMYPNISANNVRVEYSGSGLGYAGNPNGIEISPLVTVRLVGTQAAPLQFRPITTLLLANFSLPDFRTTLSSEDASGSNSY